jgi:hypothetical protein
MLRALRSAGITPDMFYFASLGSMLLSIVLWFVPRGGSDSDKGRPERLAIFVGLWPPTLFLMGHALRDEDATREVPAALDTGTSF